MTLAYDGSCFAGWQVQVQHRSIQGTLEQALADLHGHPVPVVGAGRTDAGVHATGQVASFHTTLGLSARSIHAATNARLPRDIRIVGCQDAAPGFDARRSARERIYRYYLYPAGVGYPHLRHYCWRVARLPDCGHLNALAAVLCGEQDFAAFASAGGGEKTTRRRVTRAAFHPQGPYLVFEIGANAFLRKMVRAIVGTLLELEGRSSGPEVLQAIIQGRQRRQAGATAPARGLFLERVRYDEP
jgi:tRNA pseudouridine38-40 synthase